MSEPPRLDQSLSIPARLTKAILYALYPQHVFCALCGRERVLDENDLCQACAADIHPAPERDPLPPLDGVVCALCYDGAVRQALHSFKYGARIWPVSFLADRMMLPNEWRIDVVVPIPLSPLRRWLRSFNQSELLAKRVCRRYGLLMRPNALKRVRYTRSQTRLSAVDRASNVENAFRAGQSVRGKNVLLIDDVATTLSTLRAAAAALKRAGAARVYAACACTSSYRALD